MRLLAAGILSFLTVFLVPFPAHSILETGQAESGSGTPVRVLPISPRRCPTCSFTYISGMNEKNRLVIRDRDAWRDVWKTIHRTRLTAPRLPEINFSRDMVVVAALGARRSGGYSIVVDRAFQRKDQLEIEVLSQSPGQTCIMTAALTQPVDIVRLPREESPVAFRETEIVQECK